MRQLDWVTPQQLAANEHLREIDTHLPATIANERPSGEVLSQTLAIADVAVQRAEELRSSAAASNEMTAQQTIDFNGRFGQVVRTHYTIAAQLNQAVQALEGAGQELRARGCHHCSVPGAEGSRVSRGQSRSGDPS